MPDHYVEGEDYSPRSFSELYYRIQNVRDHHTVSIDAGVYLIDVETEGRYFDIGHPVNIVGNGSVIIGIKQDIAQTDCYINFKSDNISISNVRFEDVSIQVFSGNPDTVSGIAITDSEFHTSRTHMDFLNVINTDDVEISGCTFSSTGSNNLLIQDSTNVKFVENSLDRIDLNCHGVDGIEIVDNHFTDCSVGLELESVTNYQIESNTFLKCSTGILSSDGTDHALEEENEFIGTDDPVLSEDIPNGDVGHVQENRMPGMLFVGGFILLVGLYLGFTLHKHRKA